MINGLKNNITIKTVCSLISLVLLGVVVQIGSVYLLNVVLEALGQVEDYGAYISDFMTMEPRIIVYTIAVAPLIEEIVFRAGLIGLGRKYIKKFWILNCLQAILFGIYHMNLVQGAYAFVLGALLGYVFDRCGGFLSCLTLHMVINAAGLYISPLLPSEISDMSMIAIGVACILVSYVLVRLVRAVFKQDVEAA